MKTVLASAGVFLFAQIALACGYCVEDKIASAYDHAAVTQALGQKHHVVFFHVEGAFAQDAATRRAIEALVESVSGVDRGSARFATATSTLSLAFDPKRAPLGKLQSQLERKLAARKLTLAPLRIMETPGDLAAVRPR